MRFPFSRAVAACVLLIAGCSTSVAILAATEAPSAAHETITLRQAVALALRRNPDLIASAYEISAADARLIQSDVRPNPELGVDVENFAGRGAASGVRAVETTLSLSQVVELGGKRGFRREVAQADSDFAFIDQRVRELDVLAEVASRFIDVVVAQAHVRFAQEHRSLAQQTLATIEKRIEAARAPVAEGSRARIGLTRAQIEAQQAASELRSARYALSSLWGGAEPDFKDVNADLFAFASVAPLAALMERVERNPAIARFATQARLRDAQYRLAKAQARPNLALSLGVRRFEESDDAALVAGFSMPLPAFDRNRGGILEARAQRAQTDAQLQAALLRTRGALYALYEEMTAARERAQTLRDEAIPQAHTALEQTQAGYERGRFSLLDLLTAQQELLELRDAAIDAAADHHRLLSEIERVTSEPLAADYEAN